MATFWGFFVGAGGMKRKSSLPTRRVAGSRHPFGPPNFVGRRLLIPAFLLAALLAPSANADKPYRSAAIVFPANDAAVRANGGQLTATARIAPALRPDHRVQLVFDGAPRGQPQAVPQFHLTDLDRGVHQLRIHILDSAGGIVFIGQSSEFHLLRHSVLH